MHTEAEQFADAVRHLGPDDAIRWLRHTMAGEQPSPVKPDNASWLTLVEWADRTARDDRQWALFSVDLLEHLERLPGGPGYAERGDAPYSTHVRKAIELRCRLIETHGPTPGDPVMDPAVVFAWVADQLTVELPDALQLAETVRRGRATPQRADVVRIYFLRQPLLITQRMAQTPGVTIPLDLGPWYDAIDALTATEQGESPV